MHFLRLVLLASLLGCSAALALGCSAALADDAGRPSTADVSYRAAHPDQPLPPEDAQIAASAAATATGEPKRLSPLAGAAASSLPSSTKHSRPTRHKTPN